MAHRFGLQVIAEGVEDREVLMYLKKKGCNQVQGYYFGKPMSPASFSNWLEVYQPDKDLLNQTCDPGYLLAAELHN
jgi:EAL domain-containing protein (putative c-di-GMP-specific phosphodiesterase class I)